MQIFIDTFSIVLIIAGAIFVLLGSIGLVRLPDFFTRTHAVSKIDTLGIILTLCGVVFFSGLNITSAKLVLAIVFVMIANPTGSHALANSAYKSGLVPWAIKRKPKKKES